MKPYNPLADFFDPSFFSPSLQAAIGDTKLNMNRTWDLAMKVIETEEDITDDMEDRRKIIFSDGGNVIHWEVDSLSSLYRGEVVPPSLERYPDEYVPFFATIEHQVFVYAELFGDPTDKEMKTVYSSLARQPDGKGYSLLQEHMWQACALALATQPCSKAEFEAVLRRLEKSSRTFCTHPCSKNYINTLRNHL
jgi:hypothetical protein